MTDRRKKFYSDILISIELIEGFISGIKSFEDYSIDIKTKSAVERHLSIIGEAVTNIRKIDPSDFSSAQQIISFRNRLIHAYDSIDDSIVWMIIQRHLPELKKEIEEKM